MVKNVLLIAFLFALCPGHSVNAQAKPKLYKTSNEFLYFRATAPIYRDHMDMEGGKKKYATAGNVFAQVVLNFANITNAGDPAAPTVTLTPDNVLLLEDRTGDAQRKIYKGVQATGLMKKELKPFTSSIRLKPGDDTVMTMCFHIPKTAKIVGIMYRLDRMNPLIIDFRDE